MVRFLDGRSVRRETRKIAESGIELTVRSQACNQLRRVAGIVRERLNGDAPERFCFSLRCISCRSTYAVKSRNDWGTPFRRSRTIPATRRS